MLRVTPLPMALVLTSFASAQASAAPVESVIWSNFSGVVDGGFVSDANGVLYGVVYGKNGGLAYSLTPPPPGKTKWHSTVIHYFGGTGDGSGPIGELVIGRGGVLYGATLAGGTSNGGTIFELVPPAMGSTVWTESVLYNFVVNADASQPLGSLLRTGNGSLYGTTQYYSGFSCDPGKTCGDVFRLSPPGPGQTTWSFTVLYAFSGLADGGQPNPGLVKDSTGSLYGTGKIGAMSGCHDDNGCGTVFKLTPPTKPNDTWTETTLYSFTGVADGGNPLAPLVFDSAGVLYGSTVIGGILGGGQGGGVVFALAPPPPGSSIWTESVLHAFTDGADGGTPTAGLLLTSGPALVGETIINAFKITGLHTNVKFEVLHDFDSNGDLGGPNSRIVRGWNGALFGTSNGGGNYGNGGGFMIAH
jgi:hypothetical protein